jgi:hypothetical protein
LESFIDESIRQSVAHGYHPGVFQQMRQEHGTKEAIRRLVEADVFQSGLQKVQELGLLEWSVEAAAIRFPTYFSKTTLEYTGFKLSLAKERKLKGLSHA